MSKVKHISRAIADQYMTVEEAAEHIGVKTPVLRNYLWQDRFTTYKFKTLTLLSKKEIEAWGGRNRP